MKCPCEDCLCVPMCRHKEYIRLTQCLLLKEYLIRPCNPTIRPTNRVRKLKEILQPTLWSYNFRNIFGKDNTLWIIKYG